MKILRLEEGEQLAQDLKLGSGGVQVIIRVFVQSAHWTRRSWGTAMKHRVPSRNSRSKLGRGNSEEVITFMGSGYGDLHRMWESSAMYLPQLKARPAQSVGIQRYVSASAEGRQKGCWKR